MWITVTVISMFLVVLVVMIAVMRSKGLDYVFPGVPDRSKFNTDAEYDDAIDAWCASWGNL